MLTTSTAQSTLLALTKVPTSDTVNTALLMQLWNDSRRTVGGIRGGNWPWRLIERTAYTVEDQDYVYIPNDMERVTAVRTTVGTGSEVTIYTPKLIFDEQKWQGILALRLGTDQYPYYVFQRGQKILLNPIPSVTDTPVILMGRQAIKDLSIADVTNITVADTSYSVTFTAVVSSGATSATLSSNWVPTTGEYKVTFSNSEVRIVTFTSGATTATWDDALTSGATATIGVTTTGGGSIITLSGSATADFVGRYIRITQTSAAGGGDGYWYEIGAYYSATLISLVKTYQGTELSGATAASTIGFITYEPEPYHLAPIYRAVWLWFQINDPLHPDRYLTYAKMYDGGQEAGLAEVPGGLIGQMLESADETFEGHFIGASDRDFLGGNNAPYYYPWELGTGM